MNRPYNKRNYNNKRIHFNDNYTSKVISRNKFRRDSFQNAMSGFGGQFDPINRLTYNVSTVLSRADIERLYQYDWLSRKIIEVIPDDCIRKWIDIQAPTETIVNKLNKKIKDLKVAKKFKEALINARLYKGSIIILGIFNGQKPEEKLDYSNIDDVHFLNVIDATCIDVYTYYKNPFLENYGEPELYRLNTRLKPDNYNSDDNIIHESRILRFDGAYLPEFTRHLNKGWGDSVLNAINLSLKQYGTSIQAGALLFQDFISKTLKMPNLSELLMTREGREALELRLQYAIANFSSLGIILLGDNEEFNKVQTPISGLPELMDKYIEVISAASSVPRSRLFGQTLGTLAGATETTRSYYDYVTAYQSEHLEDQIRKLIKILFLCKKGVTRGREPKNWDFKFNSLWDETNKEVTTARKMQAQVDEIYIEKKVLTPEEVAISRFRSDGYSFDTLFDINNRIGKFYEEQKLLPAPDNNNKEQKLLTPPDKDKEKQEYDLDSFNFDKFEPPKCKDAPEEVKRILDIIYTGCKLKWRDKNPNIEETKSDRESWAKIAWYAVEKAGWTNKNKEGKWYKNK